MEKKRRTVRKQVHSEDKDETEDSEDEEEEEEEEIECSDEKHAQGVEEMGNNDKSAVKNASDYMYLVGTTHYDDEDQHVFRVVKVVEETLTDPNTVKSIGPGPFVVAYRSKYIPKTGKWIKESGGSIFIEDVVRYHENIQSQEYMKSILHPKRNRILSDEDETEDSEDEEEEEEEEIECSDEKHAQGVEEMGNNDKSAVKNASDYMYLVGTTHYDDEDQHVFRVVKVVEETLTDPNTVKSIGPGPFVVAYRSKYIPKTGKWIKESGGSIFIEDVVRYHEDSKSQEIMETILHVNSKHIKNNMHCTKK